jgi:hypothetical protein
MKFIDKTISQRMDKVGATRVLTSHGYHIRDIQQVKQYFENKLEIKFKDGRVETLLIEE